MDPTPTPSEIAALVAWMERLAADRTAFADVPLELRQRLLAACGTIVDPDEIERRRLRRAFRKKDRKRERERDLLALGRAELRRSRTEGKADAAPLPKHALPANVGAETRSPPPALPAELVRPRNCYICKTPFTQVHPFYDSMCAACAELNFQKRTELCDLRGRVALVTGGRVKIGQQIVLKLLRCGASVHARRCPKRSRSPDGCRSTRSTCATRRASSASATSCCTRSTGSTSSSTTPARRSAGRRPTTPT